MYEHTTYKITTLSNDDYSWIFLYRNRLFALSKIFEQNRGFQLDIFFIDKNKNKVILKEIAKTYLNIFISDWTSFGSNLLLSGSDKEEKSNYVISININELTKKALFSAKKEDFLKIIPISYNLVIYTSVSEFGKQKLEYKVLRGLDQTNIPTINSIKIPYSGYNFFGKRFYDQDNAFFLPFMDKNYRTYLAEIRITGNKIKKDNFASNDNLQTNILQWFKHIFFRV